MFAVVEAIFMEEPPGAHVVFLVPLWSFVCVLVCKVDCPCFFGKHAELTMGGFIFDGLSSFVGFPFSFCICVLCLLQCNCSLSFHLLQLSLMFSLKKLVGG